MIYCIYIMIWHSIIAVSRFLINFDHLKISFWLSCPDKKNPVNKILFVQSVVDVRMRHMKPVITSGGLSHHLQGTSFISSKNTKVVYRILKWQHNKEKKNYVWIIARKIFNIMVKGAFTTVVNQLGQNHTFHKTNL